MNPFKNQKLKEFFESIPQEMIDLQNHLQEEQSKQDYQKFIEGLNTGYCWLCKCGMDKIDKSNPCFHWFTYPKGIKKSNFKSYLSKPVSFFQLDCYFRWLANSETPITNINDLKDETSKTSYLETTIIYKNIEWAFSIGYTDLEGHAGGKVGNFPHYHLQMKVDDQIFLKFNDFHIPFTEEDLFYIETKTQMGDDFGYEYYLGSGISALENEENIQLIDNELVITDNESIAQFRRQTLIQAQEGKEIPGELILQAFEESDKSREPVGRILKRLLSNEKITTLIAVSENSPSMTKRSGKK